MKLEKLSFIFDNNGSLISQYSRIQDDSINEWKTKFCETEQPQRHMTIKKVKLKWLSFLKLEPSDTFLPSTTVTALFIVIFG